MDPRPPCVQQDSAAPLLPGQHAGAAQVEPQVAAGPLRHGRWRAWQLAYWTLIGMLVLEVASIAAFGVLLRLSSAKNGFCSIGSDLDISISINGHSKQQLFGRTFLWTTLPTLFMSLFALAWSAVVGSYGDEMPFRGLRTGDTMKKTLWLDYRKIPSFYNWAIAWKNKHTVLGFCMALSLINTIALVPLAAHLFQLITPAFTATTAFPQFSAYNESNLVALIDYQPIISIVSAVRVYGGNWPQWTDGTYAMPAFGGPSDRRANTTSYNISIDAYSAGLDCQRVSSYTLTRNPSDGDTATLALNASDRGCPISLTAGVGPGNARYLRTESNDACPPNTGSSRIFYLAGAYSGSSTFLLDKISVISCIPSYCKTHGNMSTSPAFQGLSFTPDTLTQEDARPDNWRNFESELVSLSNIGDNNSPDFTSQFGELILNMNTASEVPDILDGAALLNSTASAFSSVFAILARAHLFTSLPAGQITATGELTYQEARLATVKSSAYVSIAILAVLAILTVILMAVVHKVPPFLAEEPDGILGAAALLQGSDLQELMQDPEWRDRGQGRFKGWVESVHVVGQERCMIDAQGTIRMVGLARRLIVDDKA